MMNLVIKILWHLRNIWQMEQWDKVGSRNRPKKYSASFIAFLVKVQNSENGDRLVF